MKRNMANVHREYSYIFTTSLKREMTNYHTEIQTNQ